MATYYVDGAVGNDTNAGTSAGSGNAWLTLSKALTTAAGGDRVWVKASATYSIGTGLSGSAGSYNSTILFEAYTTTTGDNGRATIQATAAITMLAPGDGYQFVGFIFDGNSLSTKFVAAVGTFGNVLFSRCKFMNGASSANAFTHTKAANYLGCEFATITSTGTMMQSPGEIGWLVEACYFHDITAPSILNALGGKIVGNVFDSNVGATSDAVVLSNTYYPHIVGNVFRSQGRHGINITAGYWTPMGCSIRGNIFVKCGGYGINNAGSDLGALPTLSVDYNAFGTGSQANTSGARNVIAAGDHDVSLSADPFTNAATGDFSLNATAGGGAALKGVGYPLTFPVA